MSLPIVVPVREIGKTGIKISAVGLGCMSLAPGVYGKVDDDQSVNLLNKAIDIGCNFWDTANVYGNGHSEKIISRILKDRRKDVFLATKFGIDSSSGVTKANGDPEYLTKCCNESLERLGTDYIDLYYCHRIDKNIPIETTVAAMAKLVEQGKVKYLGLSECSATTLRRAHKVHPITAVQVEYSPWTLDIERNDLLATCRELGVSVVAFSPLGRGFLSGQIKSIDDFDADDFRRNNPRFTKENFEKNLQLVDKIKQVADKKGVTSSQLCLAWLLAQGEEIFVIPGTRKEKYLVDNFEAGSLQLTSEEVAEIRDITESFNVAGERYFAPMMALLDRDSQ
ncbi:aldo/keto reductase [Umbelopsis sp. PMI_123]|nr:aldo/keto reductase [Umbelopsis sp. PMI_123]